MELYQKVRRAVMIDGMSRRRTASYFGIDRKTVDKMLTFPEPPQHGRQGHAQVDFGEADGIKPATGIFAVAASTRK